MERTNPDALSIESALTVLLRERTGYELKDLNRDATFMELGFDSLFLIQFSQQIQKRFGVKVSFRQLIEEIASINQLIEHLAEKSVSLVSVTTQEPTQHDPSPKPSTAPATPITPQPKFNAFTVSSPSPITQPSVENRHHTVCDDSVASCHVSSTAIEQIILQQNQLMAQHLALLSGAPIPRTPVPAPTITPYSMSTTKEEVEDDVETAVESRSLASSATSVERFGPYKPVRKGLDNGLTDPQRRHLNEFMDRYTRRTAKSKALAEKHRDHFADPRGVAGYRRIWKSMVYQIAVEHSKGCKLRDIDGNEYVDIAMGFGLNLFGQSPDFVTRALHEQLDRGVEVGPQSPIAGEVAKMLCEFSRKDRVTFCNTGSEAVMAALRLARTVTGKSKFVYFNKDYHGNFDQVLCRSNSVGGRRFSSPAAPGVPQMFADNSIVLDYGTPEALRVIEEQADEIAAVLIEPVQSADPFLQPREFLHEVRRITTEKNIAMIMDEVITGFRAGQGGAQEWFDVWADMSTYGKILGGGMPIGALAGTKRYMDALDGGTWRFDDDSEPEADMTFFAGTFVRHPLGLVAAQEILQKLKAEGPQLQRRLTDRTTYLVETLNTFFEQEQFPIRVAQFASQFRFMFPPELQYADILYFQMLDRGVFTRGWGDNCFLSTAHTDDDVEFVINAIRDSCLEIRRGGFFPDADADKIRPTDEDRPVEPAMSTLVEIQPNGDRTPIFCTPAADGFTRVYHELSDKLGDEQPLYGLDSPGIYGEPLPDTLQEFCAGMVVDIRRVQPHGPYQLIGYCSGGTVALEIAHQLIAAGESVSMLGMIETYNWATAASTNPSQRTRLDYTRQRIDFHIRNFFLLHRHEKGKFLNSKWKAMKIRTSVWKGLLGSKLRFKKHIKPKALVNFDELWRKHDELCEQWVPKTYPGKLIHFRPARDYRCHVGEELQATGGIEIHRMRAYPAGMMVSPFVDELAQAIGRSIDHEAASLRNDGNRESCPDSSACLETQAIPADGHTTVR